QRTQRPNRTPDSQTEIVENATRSESSDTASESTQQGAPDVIAASPETTPIPDTTPKPDKLTDPSQVWSLTDQTARANQPSALSISNQDTLPTPESDTWPLPTSLMLELEYLSQFYMTELWANAAIANYEQLPQVELSNPYSRQLLVHCDQLADQLAEYSHSVAQEDPSQMDSAIYLARVAYQMKRRSAVWLQAHQVAAAQITDLTESSPQAVADQIQRRIQEINLPGMDPQWNEYLMLDQAAEIFADPESTPVRRQAIARKIMSRATSKSLTPEQAQYAQHTIGNDLGTVLRSASLGQLDLARFLRDLESMEAEPTSGTEVRLNSHFQNYFWNRDETVQQLADTIDNNYRNANIRIELSQQMINRMIPGGRTINQPVRDKILGASVVGQSRVTNEVQVQLIPDPHHLHFRLQSNGRVFSTTRAHAQGFVFNNVGNALVNASKSIAIGESGVDYRPVNVRASADNRLTGIQSRLDNVPVVGWMARRVAQQQQQQQSREAKVIVEQKLRQEFRTRVDDEIQKQVDEADRWLRDNLLDPLHSMELEPEPVSLATTNDSAVVRYRLASMDQLAAFTPRPQTQTGSLLGMQIHRSAINNLISQAEIGGRKFTTQEFVDQLNTLLGRNDLTVEPGAQEDVTFEFASRDPIRLDFDENRILISLRLRSLQIGRQNRWRNVIVTTAYTPQASGTRVLMTLDESHGITVKTSRLNLRDQLTIRTAFSALFKTQFDFSAMPARLADQQGIQGLGIIELIASDGWLGVSIDEMPQQSAQPAAVPHTTRYPSPWYREGRWR
ncbi:MAG: hypothetical protein ACR2NP_16350, partial [Pirellulaceae bacterium]